jgi:DNA helicase-2/ATP-dependent DNA helicase PcrA
MMEKNGKTNFSNPSRFIEDIDTQYLDFPKELKPSNKSEFSNNWDDDMEIERNRFNKPSYPKFKEPEPIVHQTPKRLVKIEQGSSHQANAENASLAEGAFVKHGIFGIGKVLGTNISNGNEKVDIDFGEKGVKSLLLKFAKLEVLH